MSGEYNPKNLKNPPGRVPVLKPSAKSLEKRAQNKADPNDLMQKARLNPKQRKLSLVAGEIFQLVAEAPTKTERAEILQTYDSQPLRYLIKLALDPTIKFNLPEGEVPYRKSDAPTGWADSNLFQEVRRLYVFTNDKRAKPIKPTKLESLFINMLQDLDAIDAELLVNIKDKKLPGVTRKLIHEVFPGLLSKTTDDVEEESTETNPDGAPPVTEPGEDVTEDDTTQPVE